MLNTQKAFAKEIPLAPDGGLTGPGITPTEDIGGQIAGIVSTVIGVLTVLAIVWFIIEFVVSAYLLISSAGDQEKTAEAKKRLTQSVVGLVIVIGAIFIINIIAYIAGIDFLNVGEFINDLSF
ncbi:MAG: hypothetical protein PHW57_03605 [Candidatus Shapirobacteria bacterium]|nr:hypothetical protein [Candidatus Shapirobacteria bacterium]